MAKRKRTPQKKRLPVLPIPTPRQLYWLGFFAITILPPLIVWAGAVWFYFHLPQGGVVATAITVFVLVFPVPFSLIVYQNYKKAKIREKTFIRKFKNH